MSKLVVLDLDNTLYDWVEMFVASFYAMIDSAVKLLDCDRDRLLDEMRDVHRKHHDSEHPFALLETSTVLKRFPEFSRDRLKESVDSAFYAFNAARKKALKEYPGVTQGLVDLSAEGCRIVAHTESNVLAAFYRLEKLGLLNFFERVYCRERTADTHPDLAAGNAAASRLAQHNFVSLKFHRRKPDPSVLREILRAFDVEPNHAFYVGDSLTRDMKMAADVGVTAIWAKYGTRHLPGAYEKLVRVTHWTEDDVDRERALGLAAKSVRPDFIAENSFAEVVAFIRNHTARAQDLYQEVRLN